MRELCCCFSDSRHGIAPLRVERSPVRRGDCMTHCSYYGRACDTLERSIPVISWYAALCLVIMYVVMIAEAFSG
jgi:hypothetical protein